MMDNQYADTFKEEASELLAELENSLLELEDSPDDTELIGRVFRALHTIKGSGAMFGFDDIAAFTHQVETAFDQVRNGKLSVSRKMIDLTLAARDQIKTMLGGAAVDAAGTAQLIAGFKELMNGNQEAAPAPQGSMPPSTPSVAASEDDFITYRIRFKPDRNVFANGTNPVALLNELRQLGNCRIVAQMCDVPVLGDIDPECCYIFWDVILTTASGLDAIKDVFIFVEDYCEIRIDPIDGVGNFDDEAYKKLGQILVERGDIDVHDIETVLSTQKRLGEMLVEKGMVGPSQIQSALLEQQHVKEVRQERKQKEEKAQAQEAGASIRVPAEKLDVLVNLVGELVTIQARMTQTAAGREDAELISIAEEVERLTAELRDNALNIRMLPIGITFNKFKRLVRDLSGELGKEIEMATEGAETELDKTVIERLNDPMVHLIRNCIDHGIERPEVRETAGKPRQGTVRLAAVHSGDSVLLTIEDDGAGLDKEAILAKAVEKGMVAPSAELSEQEIYNLIFAAGFSTAAKITSVSGRGVGMDVVKRAIDDLRGSISINCRPGQGTVISVKIPLTMAIIETLLVEIGDDHFLIPLSLVDECIELTRADVAASHGRNMATVRGHLVPYIPLRRKFSIAGTIPDIEQVVITELNGTRVGFVVDNVIGEHQTVIKSLGPAFKHVEDVSGATILGDGSVALILDIPQLVRSVEENCRQ
ncbi:MAG: chemotaxis protein CheA [Proteobacteria bacterium]|nr:chemotaxis protein CheA [Pseudomonadota bacterium]MBU4294828.1 chemotaxis protein CheA [Pseudomonadota bacterium]MCG2749328.1 chemotaxis protein CheA [Desulfobulbaceae bacterium]